MKRIFKGAGKVLKGIGKGIVDTCLPNLQKSIKMSSGDLPDDKPKFEIDFVRLFTSVTIWILLLLVFTGKVKFSEVLDIILKFMPK